MNAKIVQLTKNEIKLLIAAVKHFNSVEIGRNTDDFMNDNYNSEKSAQHFAILGVARLLQPIFAKLPWESGNLEISEIIKHFIPAINQMIFSLKHADTTDDELNQMCNLVKKLDSYSLFNL